MTRSHFAKQPQPALHQDAPDSVPFAHVFMPLCGVGEGLYLVIAAVIRLIAPKTGARID